MDCSQASRDDLIDDHRGTNGSDVAADKADLAEAIKPDTAEDIAGVGL
jgi:hypothetical protein